jgi:hypothetical protein
MGLNDRPVCTLLRISFLYDEALLRTWNEVRFELRVK